MCVQVLPASIDLYMPSPLDRFARRQASPIPTYTTAGFDSATAIAPTDPAWKKLSETFVQVTPASSVFHTPPPVAPM